MPQTIRSLPPKDSVDWYGHYGDLDVAARELLAAGFYSLRPAVGSWLVDVAPGGTSTLGQSEQELDLIPRFIPEGTYDAIAINVVSAGATGALIKPALYFSDGGAPSTLASSAPAADGTTTGVKTFTLNTALVVPFGGRIIWGGVVCQGGASSRPQFTRVTGQMLNNRVANVDSSAFTAAGYPQNYYTTGVSGEPPATWTDTRRYDSAPRMAYRRSA